MINEKWLKRGVFLAVATVLAAATVKAQNTITTVAGGGPNNMPGTSATLQSPSLMATDGSGNLYVVDNSACYVFKVTPVGQLTILAGTGNSCEYGGDGGPATKAGISPLGVAVDASGNVYISENTGGVGGGPRIRRVDAATGIITTYAGNGTKGYTGDGGLATSAELNFPTGLAIDLAGNLYIADSGNFVVRRVSPSGVITTFAGDGIEGFSGDGGPASAAQLSTFNQQIGLAVDSAGNLYIADRGNQRIRVVNTQAASITVASVTILPGDIQTVAGNGTAGFSGDGGPATSAEFAIPECLAVDGSGNIFIGDLNNQRVRRVAATGIITTVAGVGTAGFSGDGGAATTAELNEPQGVAVDSSGDLFIGDNSNYRVRRVDGTTADISTFVGDANLSFVGSTVDFNGDGFLATDAWIYDAFAAASDSSDNLYVADDVDGLIRRIDHSTGIIGTVAGMNLCTSGFSGDHGPATNACLNFPDGVTLDGNGNLYIDDSGNNRIRVVNRQTSAITVAGVTIAAGDIATVAGTGTTAYNGDGIAATSANIGPDEPVGLDGSGNIFIADIVNNRIRRVDAVTGVITSVAGDGTRGFAGDGGPAISAQLNGAEGVTLDSSGNIYIPDSSNNVVRVVNTQAANITVAGVTIAPGDIETVAGDQSLGSGYSGDGGPALSAQMSSPLGVAVDSSGNLYIGDFRNNRVRLVTSSGTMTTFAGSGATGVFSGNFTGDGGPAASATLAAPIWVDFDSAGHLLIADSFNNRIREVILGGGAIASLSPSTISFGNQSVGTTSAAQTITMTNTGTANLAFAAGAVTLSGTNAADFAISTDTCSGATVAPTATCTVDVTFTPSVNGAEAASLNFTDNAAVSPQAVSLTGTGVLPTATASPSTLTFTAQLVGTTSAIQTITLSNSGSVALTITGISTNLTVFGQTNTCGTSVAAGGTCTISVTFTPTATGLDVGMLTIADNAFGSPQTVNLTGTGALPIVTLLPASLTFGATAISATSAAQTVTLSNTGTVPLTITSISSNLAVFGETSTCGASLAGGANCAISITFTPSAAGVVSGTLSVADNATGSPQVVTLSGTGQAPSVTVSASSLNFNGSTGGQPVGSTTAAQTVTVTNNSSAALTISSITASGDFAQTSTCGTSVAVGASCTISVTFSPTATGSRVGTLTINDNAPNSPQTVALSGTGQDFSVTPTSTSVAITAGQVAVFNLTVAPLGGFERTVSLTCTGAPPPLGCLIVPSSIRLSPTTPATAQVDLATVARTLGTPTRPGSPPFNDGLKLMAFLLGVLSLSAAWFTLGRRSRRAWILLPVLLGMIALWGGCEQKSTGTPAGTYTITVTSTSGSLTHAVNLQLTVH
ncbi:MAG TPA: choice-of-anchor D domain-containing protein [Terriglobia bacterium]|nr:choice-of-anchor D domain-containing protein [Terriglobia bacterium]